MFTGILGLNGCGKSTLFKMLSMAENFPTTGILTLRGIPWYQKWRVMGSKTIGYVPQHGGLLEFLTVKQTYEIFATIKQSRVEACNRLLESKYMSYPVATLSGGNKKKLAVDIARGFPLLLLDEVTSGIDPIASEKIVSSLKLNDQSSGVLFCSHRIDEVLQVCHRVVIMHEGRMVYDGSASYFDALSRKLLQIDIVLDFTVEDAYDKTIEAVKRANHVHATFFRIVPYEASLIRLTWLRDSVSLSMLWTILQGTKGICTHKISRYCNVVITMLCRFTDAEHNQRV
jgi:ABC-type multidrug transport system ATPase subunit